MYRYGIQTVLLGSRFFVVALPGGCKRFSTMAIVAADAADADPFEAAPPAPAGVPRLPPVERDHILTHVSYEGRLFLDQVADDTWQLTCTATHWRYMLHGGRWILEITGNTASAARIGNDGELEETVDVQVEQHTLLVEEAGNPKQYLVENSAPADFKVKSFDVARCSHHEGVYTLSLDGTAAELEITCYCFQRKRGGGLNMFFGMRSLYCSLGFTSYKKQASKWTYTNTHKWETLMNGHFDGDHFIHGNSKCHSADWLEAHSAHMRCLPEPSLSSAAFIKQLLVWAMAHKAAGGKDSAADANKCRKLLFKLLDQALFSREPFTFQLFATYDWRSRWPRRDHPGISDSLHDDIVFPPEMKGRYFTFTSVETRTQQQQFLHTCFMASRDAPTEQPRVVALGRFVACT